MRFDRSFPIPERLQQPRKESFVVPRVIASAQPQAHHHQAAARDHADKLTLVTHGVECVGRKLRGWDEQAVERRRHLDPEVGAEVFARGLGRERRHVFHPALGQDTAAPPHAPLKQKLAEPRPVARGGVHVRGGDERAGGIRLDDGAAHPDRVEQCAPGEAQVVLLGTAHRPADHAGEDVAGAARVLPARPRRSFERFVDRVAGTVGAREQHERYIRFRVAIALREMQTARHAQQLIERDVGTRIAGTAPLGQQRLLLHGQLTALDQGANQHRGRGLGHRPAWHGRGSGEARCIALGDDAAVAQDDQRAGAPQPCGVGLGERPVDSIAQLQGVRARTGSVCRQILGGTGVCA